MANKIEFLVPGNRHSLPVKGGWSHCTCTEPGILVTLLDNDKAQGATVLTLNDLNWILEILEKEIQKGKEGK